MTLPQKDAPKKASGVTSPVSDKGRASGGGERDAGAEARERLKSRSSDSGSTRKLSVVLSKKLVV